MKGSPFSLGNGSAPTPSQTAGTAGSAVTPNRARVGMAPDALPLPLLWGGAVDQLESQSLSWPLPNRRPTLVLSRVAKCCRWSVCASTFTATAAVLSVGFSALNCARQF